MTRVVLLLCAVLASVGFDKQLKTDQLVPVYGVGTRSCGGWLEARASERDRNDVRSLQFQMWVDGYLTGYQFFYHRDKIFNTDMAGMKGFLDKYCRENPTDGFIAAVNQFIVDQGGRLPAVK